MQSQKKMQINMKTYFKILVSLVILLVAIWIITGISFAQVADTEDVNSPNIVPPSVEVPQKPEVPSSGGNSGRTGSKIAKEVVIKFQFTKDLFWGVKDADIEVAELQKIVGTKVDGKFGRLTYWAVRYFQAQNGLIVDGIIGEQSRALLNK